MVFFSVFQCYSGECELSVVQWTDRRISRYFRSKTETPYGKFDSYRHFIIHSYMCIITFNCWHILVILIDLLSVHKKKVIFVTESVYSWLYYLWHDCLSSHKSAHISKQILCMPLINTLMRYQVEFANFMYCVSFMIHCNFVNSYFNKVKKSHLLKKW